MKKKAGFRYVMDVIPLDATLVKGSHGRIGVERKYQPVLISDMRFESDLLASTEIFETIWTVMTSETIG